MDTQPIASPTETEPAETPTDILIEIYLEVDGGE